MKVFTPLLVIFSLACLLLADPESDPKVIESKINNFGNKINEVLSKELTTQNTFFSPLGLHVLLSYFALYMPDFDTRLKTYDLLQINYTQVLYEYKPILQYLKSVIKETALVKVVVNSILCLPNVDVADVVNMGPKLLADKFYITTLTDECNKDHAIQGSSIVDLHSEWDPKHKFTNTYNLTFTALSGEKSKVPIMLQLTENLQYRKDDELQAQVVKLSTQTPSVYVAFIVPDLHSDFAVFEEKVAKTDVGKLLKTETHEGKINLLIPQLIVNSTEIDIGPIIQKAGFPDLINNDKIFGALDPKLSVNIHSIKQTVSLLLAETGLEVQSEGDLEGESAEDIKLVKADHPFYLYLVSNSLGYDLVLFQGRIVAVPAIPSA